MITFSIIIPTYNRARYLEDAIKSILEQDRENLPHYEIIIVDNASFDNTKEVFYKFKDKCKILYKFEKK